MYHSLSMGRMTKKNLLNNFHLHLYLERLQQKTRKRKNIFFYYIHVFLGVHLAKFKIDCQVEDRKK